MVTFSVIIPTVGRLTLLPTLASVTHQLEEGDEILVLRKTSHWGAESRQQMVTQARGSHLIFMDDDDIFTDDALDEIRRRVGEAPDRVHIFKMRYSTGHELWKHPIVEMGNVGTPMFCVPNEPGLVGDFGDQYENDYWFISSTLKLRDEEPIWQDKVIALIRPYEVP